MILCYKLQFSLQIAIHSLQIAISIMNCNEQSGHILILLFDCLTHHRRMIGPVEGIIIPTWRQCQQLLYALNVVTLIYATKIDMCPCDETIYYGPFKTLQRCPQPTCGIERFKANGSPQKSFWDLGLIEQLLYWFEKCGAVLRHSATQRTNFTSTMTDIVDSPRWKEKMAGHLRVDDRHLGLLACWDGLNPFGTFSQYSLQTGTLRDY